VLVLRPGALGDTLLAVPALRALGRRFGPLRLAANFGAARLLASLGEVEEGLAFDDPSLAWLFADSRKARGVSPLGDAMSAENIVAWMQPPQAGTALSHALLVAPSRPPGEQHCAEYLLESLTPLGVDTSWLDDRPLNVAPISSDEVLIHPGSGAATKNWPAPKFADVIRALDRPVRLIVGEADTAAALAVEECLGHSLPRGLNLPLEELAARLAGCNAYVGNDSGVSHLAGLCGARTVVLFGPTSPAVWRPLGPRVQVMPFEAETEHVVAAVRGG
jgi:ADP-heptose:LPS heptosyltransferase